MEIYRDTEHPMPMEPQAPKPTGRGRAVLAGSVLAGALVVGGGAYAMADPSTPAPSPTTAGAEQEQSKGAAGRQGDRAELGRPIHGETVVSKDGTYTTVRMQEVLAQVVDAPGSTRRFAAELVAQLCALRASSALECPAPAPTR